MKRLLFLSVVFTILAGTAARAAGPACQPVINALAKLSTTPFHAYESESADYLRGKTRSSESIHVNHLTYVYYNSRWRVSPMTEQDRQDMRKTAEANLGNGTCRMVGEEPVNGEAATVYSVHQQTPDTKIDTQVWISRTRACRSNR